MKLLIDTHVFLWWILDSPELSATARSLMSDGRNDLYWSPASSWEIGDLVSRSRLTLPDPAEEFLLEELEKNRVLPLPINDHHALRAAQLPILHSDLVDRLLVAQAQVESMVIVSPDPLLWLYDITVKW